MEEGVREGEGQGRVLVVAGLWWAGIHGLEKLEVWWGRRSWQVRAVARASRRSRSTRVPCCRQGCGVAGVAMVVGAAWVVLGRSLVRLGGGAGGCCALCGATAFPSSLSDCSKFPAVFFSFGWCL